MFPSDEVRKKVLYHVGVWLMVSVSAVVALGNQSNDLHVEFLDSGMNMIGVLVLGVVLNTGVEAAFHRKDDE